MWNLKRMTPGGAWEAVDSFDDVTAAARKITEIEAYPVTGVFFEILIDPNAGSEEAFGHLEHTGRNSGHVYVVQRLRH